MARTTINSSRVGDFTLLRKRLQALRDYYHDSFSVWDIGCDHALLGLSFIDEASVKEIHLVDPSKDVIEGLKLKLLDSYITSASKTITLHHQKGQKISLNPQSKTIFIAGMGGKEIQEILIHLEPQLTVSDRIVISPHRKILEVRNYLYHSNYRLIEERIVLEDGQFYQIMCLSLDQTCSQVSLYGESIWAQAEGRMYLKHQISTYSCHKDEASQRFLAYLKRVSN